MLRTDEYGFFCHILFPFFSVHITMLEHGNIGLVDTLWKERRERGRESIKREPSNWQTHKGKDEWKQLPTENFINEHFVTWWLRWIRLIDLSHHSVFVVLLTLLLFFVALMATDTHIILCTQQSDRHLQAGNFKLLEPMAGENASSGIK